MDIIDWQIMSNGLNEEINSGIILYGASGSGEKAVMLLKELGLTDKILSVVDSDKKKWGKKWMQYKVLSPYKLKDISSNAIIVITSVYLKEIKEFLQNEIKCKQKICSIFSLRAALHYGIMNNKANYIANPMIKNYKNKYNLWKKNMILLLNNIHEKCFFDIARCIMEKNISIILCGIHKTGNITLENSFNKIIRNDNFEFAMHLMYFNADTFKYMLELLKKFNKNEIRIISGIREPIERIISQKWQSSYLPYRNNDTCIPTLIDDRYENFVNNLMLSEEKNNNNFNCADCFYSDIVYWYKDQIEKVFGIDVFKYPFDKEKGYTILKANNISIFIYRLDKLSNLEKEIGEFIGDNSFRIMKANEASKKGYVFAYDEYFKHVKIKKSFFDMLVNSKGMTHFYTKEECDRYRNKWENKLI